MTTSGGGGRRHDTPLGRLVEQRLRAEDRRLRVIVVLMCIVWLAVLVALAVFAPELAIHWIGGSAVGGVVGHLIGAIRGGR